MTETLELAVVNAQNSVEIFTKGGLSAVLDEVEKRVRAIALDASTATGREQIRSVAYKVTRTKTALDAEAKKLTEGWRESTKRVNEERKVSQERLDALADEVREPLTVFENKEKLRVAGHEAALADLAGLIEMLRANPNMEASLLEEHQQDFAQLNANREWEEFGPRANYQRNSTLAYLSERIAARKKFDADQAELVRLRKEEVERKAREREEKIKSEAAEKARIEAEFKAKEAADAEAKRVIDAANAEQARVKAEADRVRAEHERAQKEAEAKANAIEQQRIAEQNARIDAERRVRESEEARIAADNRAKAEKKAAEAKAEADLKAAVEKAKRDQEAAIAKERERVAAQRKDEEEAQALREADEAARSRVHAEIMEDIAKFGKLANAPEAIIAAIMDGKVRHVRVAW